jgi:hypothetical protein
VMKLHLSFESFWPNKTLSHKSAVTGFTFGPVTLFS